MPEGEIGRSLRERLQPLIIGMKPDLRSCVTVTRSLSHVYYGLQTGVVDPGWIDLLMAMKDEGILYREVFEAILEIFKEHDAWRPLVRDMNILVDTRPDFVWGRKRIIQVVERPSRHRPIKRDPPPTD